MGTDIDIGTAIALGCFVIMLVALVRGKNRDGRASVDEELAERRGTDKAIRRDVDNNTADIRKLRDMFTEYLVTKTRQRGRTDDDKE